MNTELHSACSDSVLHPAEASVIARIAVPAYRVLLIGVQAFTWLRLLQERAPGPRIDLRYFVEGVVEVLRTDESLHEAWLQCARQALVEHVAMRGAAARARTGRLLPADGAQARTSGSTVNLAHHEDCKALQVGECAFQWLKTVQGTTRDPRLDMRYLVEGALALFHGRAEFLPLVLRHARRGLRDHLAQLEARPIEPISLEKR